MAKYLPLQCLDKYCGEGDELSSFLKYCADLGQISDDITLDDVRDYAFGQFFFSPLYIGRLRNLNKVIMKDKEMNTRLMPSVDFTDIRRRKTEWRDLFSSFPALTDWSKYKKVYKVDNDFFHEIKQTENLEFTNDILPSMPYPAFYIDLSNVNDIEPFMGAFCHIYTDEYEDYQILSVFMVTDELSMFSFYLPFWFGRTEDNKIPFKISTDTSTFLQWHYDIEQHKAVSTQMKTRDCRPEIVTAISQLVMFIHADIDDISENPVTKSTYKPFTTVKNKFSEIQMFDVGLRYGKAIKVARDEAERISRESIETTKSRKPMRPHVRAAHWQRYHVGKGRKEIKVNWIPPVYVCGGKEISVTIHNVGR